MQLYFLIAKEKYSYKIVASYVAVASVTRYLQVSEEPTIVCHQQAYSYLYQTTCCIKLHWYT